MKFTPTVTAEVVDGSLRRKVAVHGVLATMSETTSRDAFLAFSRATVRRLREEADLIEAAIVEYEFVRRYPPAPTPDEVQRFEEANA